MEWTKTKLTRWTAGEFRITEEPESGNLRPFLLDGPGSMEKRFETLGLAKAYADLLNRLALAEEDNARLRAELDTRAGKWPPPLEDEDRLAAQRFDGITDGEEDRPIEDGYDAPAARHLPDDGRGIPAPRLAAHG